MESNSSFSQISFSEYRLSLSVFYNLIFKNQVLSVLRDQCCIHPALWRRNSFFSVIFSYVELSIIMLKEMYKLQEFMDNESKKMFSRN